MDTTDSHLLVERDEGLVILRLNQPARLNALSPNMLEGLDQEVTAATADPTVRAILLTGVGRGFCAGGDIMGMGGKSPDRSREGMAVAHGWVKRLRFCEKLVITAVNGAAAGGGFGIALLGDIVLASTAAFFKAGFTDLGVAADYGLGWTLPRAVGGPRAADILFSDRRIAAEEAFALGLVSRLIDAAAFEAEALAFARRMANAARGAQLTKRLLRVSETEAFAAYLRAEAETQVEAFQSRDFQEGIAAFKEKRPARFSGG
jgi:2-(1,2-epoxy-1,2-dihydrophenyl)acetyl-CoA isomerase